MTTLALVKSLNWRPLVLDVLVVMYNKHKTHCLHYIGFNDDRIWNVRRIWGEPDFYHRTWDYRARQEMVPGDIAIFANGTIDDPPKPISWDDSQQDVFTYGGKEMVGL